jgi:hypothetical protein
MFNDMREVDPYRTDEVDTYSNILYTMKRQADLSQLAQHFMAVNKDRPEVSLVIGMNLLPCIISPAAHHPLFPLRKLLQLKKRAREGGQVLSTLCPA